MRLATILLASSLTAAVFAQSTSEITTVRPRITDTTNIVLPTKLQVEAGVDFGFGGFDGGRSNNYGQVLLRYGINDRMEVRVGLPSYTDYEDFDSADGWSDTLVAVSYYLGSYGKARFSVLPGIMIPTGSKFNRVDKVAPSIYATGELPLNSGWSLASTVGYAHTEYDFDGFKSKNDVWHATLAIQKEINMSTSAFAEYSGYYQNGSQPLHMSNFGVRHRLTPTSQVDAHVLVPIDNIGQNSIGIGYAIRF